MTDKKPAPKKPTIAMKSVDSSSVAAHGYDAASKTLAVQFKGGHVYHYTGVPQSVADGLGSAKSVGGYFAAHVRDQFKAAKQ